MNKDVIYIDVEDDITAIIGKVKDAKEKIVALVPPKRIGVLQSAVNLRLLERAAGQQHKRMVLITTNSSLMALAAAAKIPVAKNLQSKPEIAQIDVLDVDDGEDVIDGSHLPVGELARTADGPLRPAASANISDEMSETLKATPPGSGNLPTKPRIKNGLKVPNFSSFRKKLILGITAGVLLIGFLVWAIFFAPQATITIKARTTESSANAQVTLSNTATTDAATKTLKSVTQTNKKDASAEFEPTGTKDVGEKATGTMTITRSGVSDSATTIPAGTQFSANGLTFVSTAAAVVPRSEIIGSKLENGTATVSVQASAIGGEYNLSARAYQPSVGGYTAKGSDMAGGSKRQIKTVSEDDVKKAVEQLAGQNSDEIKQQLTAQFDATYIVAEQSFKVDQAAPQVTPAVDSEVAAGTKGKVTISTTYSLSAVPKADIGGFLDAYFADQLKDTKDQHIYENGAQNASLANIVATPTGFTANIVATAKIGPKIDNAAVKETAKGKRYGDVQSALEAIQGVDDVEVKFWPFWVGSVPDNVERIKIEFNLSE